MELDHLFNAPNPKCSGCTILEDKSLPMHCDLDYEGKDPVDILFVSDSLKLHQGSWVPFRVPELNVISAELRKFLPNKFNVGYTASVKCPNITNDDIKAKDRKICRSHLVDSIIQYKPKLVFLCGKLATTMMYGKNIDDKKGRGRIDDLEVGGHKFKSMSIIHPWMVVSEPKNAFLFTNDIQNGISTEILKVERKNPFYFETVDSIQRMNEIRQLFLSAPEVSVDIETTGLNFLEDTIHTISFTIFTNEYVKISIPWDHKDNKQGYKYKAAVAQFTEDILANENSIKVFQGGKFDLKFLKRYGITRIYNVWDTKLMQHMVLEDVPKDLRSLVQYHCPNEAIE